MLKPSDVLEKLSSSLKAGLAELGAVEAESRVKQLGPSEVLRFGMNSSRLYTALEGFEFEEERLRLDFSGLLIIQQRGEDKKGLSTIDLAIWIGKYLSKYCPEYADGVVSRVRGQNLSLENNALLLWGFSFSLKIATERLSSELGEICEISDLNEFLEAGGESQLIQSEIEVG